ncbi:Potassium uptake protein TrkH [Lentimonas sp. CC19]|nr:Potassium uptake protein TrkH [Lentimonas sp. CC4]CAA6685268.1 Potassium uptake protein TrkH [Lentimonas sp. CC6]CAA6690348.1 Potassium uptake protein TrkH [Lentimonas sp. CC10]CAA6693062.1 Potassium uptake protein TrkH [Lentimonas sp. CC19]CAA7069031.1 Potassium uptake protein TrkH [Lentimonas sp. CC11]CAA7171054.1 Potassium uptake protein TrkH [Lentimonas sp. CC21]CAA7180649.1 Potassium uptake protein TrkH [Lentimonas sp. CC8]
MVLLALAGAFGLCVLAGFACGETYLDQSIQAFALSIGIALLLSALFLLLGRKGNAKLFRREALCTIGLSWLLATIVGSIPYILIVEDCSIADAIFESSSGLTTTGATAFPEFYEFPKSLLFWRSLSQWVGGLGVVVFFVAILSSLGAGAKILFSNESSGTSSDFDHGRIQSGAFYLMLYYLGLSFSCMLAYAIGGMNWFQAINHAMTTVATGGFSTEPISMEQFQSPVLEWISIVFMTLSGATFVFVIRILRGRSKGQHKNNEVYWYLGIIVGSTALLTLYLTELTGQLPDHDSIRAAAFQTVSIMTTTGYSTVNFDTWLPSAKMVLLILMVIGGCSGSTGGGVKVVRIVIATRTALRSIVQSFRPNITKPMRMGGKVISESAIQSVIVFLMLVAIIEIASMVFVSAIEPSLTFMEVFSCVQTTLFNVGPGFKSIGPAENFNFLHSTTKIFLSLLMILGRLEFYAVLVLFSPTVWKRYS